MTADRTLTSAGLFAGIGGIELGLHQAGIETTMLCEVWDPAMAVLRERFPSADLVGDIQDLDRLPDVDLVTAGFPCTDLSQAGRMDGISGSASGLVSEVFRLLDRTPVEYVLLENVRNMLHLDQGRAMSYLVSQLEQRGYRWAYRLVDSRFTGVPQRRQRVILLASRSDDPADVLFADDSVARDEASLDDDLFGFYWTEGKRGLGWAQDAVPTLKGGSTIGIPSPPGIWDPTAPLGRRLVTPSIETAERLQGFRSGWTKPAEAISKRAGTRWKLVGNAVSVGVSRWVGNRLTSPGTCELESTRLSTTARWPQAAHGEAGRVWEVPASLWPERTRYRHLRSLLSSGPVKPLSARASAGFLQRANDGGLRFAPGFLEDVAEHASFMADQPLAA